MFTEMTFFYNFRLKLPASNRLYDTRHTSLYARFTQSRDNHRRTLLRGSPEHREELCNSALGPISLFNQVYRYTPPSE
jgi:hypothetical protein